MARFRPQGFTLVELLVVIAIVAALAGIGLVGVQTLRVKANTAVCAGNLRQIGQAIMMYQNEHSGNFPRSTHDRSFSESWIFTLAPYLRDVDEIRICPADPRKKELLENNGTSYVFNEYLVTDRTNAVGQLIEQGYTKLSKIPAPANTISVFTTSEDRGASMMEDHTHSRGWAGNWQGVIGDIEPNRHRRGGSNADKTNGVANYLYVDGHVSAIHAEEFRRRIQAGENPALPPES